jgi:hypothetical protein
MKKTVIFNTSSGLLYFYIVFNLHSWPMFLKFLDLKKEVPCLMVSVSVYIHFFFDYTS